MEIASIMTHVEASMSFMAIMADGAERWYPLADIKDLPVFRSYMAGVGPERKARVQEALDKLSQEGETSSSPQESSSPLEASTPPGPSDSTENPSSPSPADADTTPTATPADSDRSEETEKPKPKRGRGRPPKPKPAEDSTVATPPKRGRGRPPKKKPADTDPDKPKRPRGRPPKNRDSVTVTSTSSPSDGTPVKRGRGRPRKRPLSPDSHANGVPKTKRGRGRPRKVQKTEPTTEAATPVKRGRGRPRKYSMDGSAVERGVLPHPVATRRSLITERGDEGTSSDSESDAVSFSDSSEEIDYFDFDQDGDDRGAPPSARERGEEFYRPIRVSPLPELNKSLVREERISIHDPESLSLNHLRALAALECYLPVVKLIRLVRDTNDLLCLLCGHRVCHGRCPIRVASTYARDTYQWMQHVTWTLKGFTPPQPYPTLTDSLFQEHLVAFLRQHESLVSSELMVQATSEPWIGTLVAEHRPTLEYMAQKLHVHEIHPARFQRATYRLFMADWKSLVPDDMYLLMKMYRLLYLLQTDNQEADQAWRQLRFDSPPLSMENGETPSSSSSPSLQGLGKLAEFMRILYQSVGVPLEKDIAQPGSPVELGADETQEQQANEWGINLEYVENSTPQPVVHAQKCALYCSVTPRQSPPTIARTILRRLEKELNLLVDEQENGATEGDRVIASFFATSKSGNTRINCTADNWAGSNNVHLFIRITSTELSSVVDTFKREIGMLFRLDDIEKHLTILYYKQVHAQMDDLQLEFTTGEAEAEAGTESYQVSPVIQYPSTLCVGRYADGEEAIRMLLTYSHNMETFVNGPTIQYLAVKKAYRQRKLASNLLHHLESRFLRFWKPHASEYQLYASYVTNAHDFFLKQDFHFYDFFWEECVKDVDRAKFKEELGEEKAEEGQGDDAMQVDPQEEQTTAGNSADSTANNSGEESGPPDS